MEIEGEILTLLNSHASYLSMESLGSTRAVGDAIQTVIADNFEKVLGDLSVSYSADFSRKAMADLAFTDAKGYYYVVDVKTHRLETHFNMPNLISVERLTRFYEDEKNYFLILLLKYQALPTSIRIEEVHFVPIEYLNWNCLTIGALGWGQIQIANANFVEISPENTRANWMLSLCDTMIEFYHAEVEKIEKKRIGYFESAKERWLNKIRMKE
jgi:hypothetical protein